MLLILYEAAAGGEIFAAAIAHVRLGRLIVYLIGRRLHAGNTRAIHAGRRQIGVPRGDQQLADGLLRLIVLALSKIVATDPPIGIDEVMHAG